MEVLLGEVLLMANVNTVVFSSYLSSIDFLPDRLLSEYGRTWDRNKFLFSSFDHLYISIFRLYHICTTLYHICIFRLYHICSLWSSENRSFSTVDARLPLWYRFPALREKLLFNSILPKEKLPWAWAGQNTNNAFYCFFLLLKL